MNTAASVTISLILIWERFACPTRAYRILPETQTARVVIPVAFTGLGTDLPAMAELSETYGFSFIEDSAHTLGGFYQADEKRYACGSCAHTDLIIFSFHSVKTITTGEGAVMTNSPWVFPNYPGWIDSEIGAGRSYPFCDKLKKFFCKPLQMMLIILNA